MAIVGKWAAFIQLFFSIALYNFAPHSPIHTHTHTPMPKNTWTSGQEALRIKTPCKWTTRSTSWATAT